MSLTYGTSGFRTHHSKIEAMSEKIGTAMAMAVIIDRKSFGIMITASHNHHEDNGIKVLDEHGHMIGRELEDFIVKQVCGSDMHAYKCSDIMKNILYESNIVLQIGYDSRKSSPYICELIVKGVRMVHPQFPIVITPYITTPHLHFIFSDQGRKISYVEYLQNVASLVNFPCILDCANGIGSKVMIEIKESIPQSPLTLINTNWEQHALLNHNCSSDFVCTYKELPHPHEPAAYTNQILRASLDGDADRVVFYYTEMNALHILNGDYIAALILTYLSKTLSKPEDDYKESIASQEANCSQQIGEGVQSEDPPCLTIGFVYTGYTNSACVEYVKSLPFPPYVCVSCVCTATGVKHLHAEAEKYDVGVYFEQNGHGNVLFHKNHPQLTNIGCFFHPNIGDGVLDLFATLYILQVLNMTVQDWKKLYNEKHTKMSKIEVQDKNIFICNANELELIEPAYVQDYIERLCSSQQRPCRAFVRASGTENVVRLFVESENSGIMELVHWKITSYINQKMADAIFHIKNTSFSLRALRLQDLGDSYFTLLGQLSVMDIEKMDADQSAKLFRRFGDHHQIHVLEEKESGLIVGTGTLFIEDKFLRNYGKVGHIEDIVVHSDYRGYGLGKIMIEHLTKQAKMAGCYKCILDCSDDNVGFYEKCGYVKKGAQMGAYF